MLSIGFGVLLFPEYGSIRFFSKHGNEFSFCEVTQHGLVFFALGFKILFCNNSLYNDQ